MSDIDWSKAPEGATHYSPKLMDDDMWSAVFWRVENNVGVEAWQIDNDTGGLNHFSRPTWMADTLKRMIARPQEWTGTGLPPVGTVCEYYIDDDKWRQCEIVAHKDGYAVIWLTAAHVFSARSCGLLRPLRTQEQIEAEEREKAIAKMCSIVRDKVGFGVNVADMAALYDAGYRKQEPKQ